jgi:hypothetical protein
LTDLPFRHQALQRISRHRESSGATSAKPSQKRGIQYAAR